MESCLVLLPPGPRRAAGTSAEYTQLDKTITSALEVGLGLQVKIREAKLMDQALLREVLEHPRVVADLAGPSSEVLYLLGARQAHRKQGTVLIHPRDQGGAGFTHLTRICAYDTDAAGNLTHGKQFAEELKAQVLRMLGDQGRDAPQGPFALLLQDAEHHTTAPATHWKRLGAAPSPYTARVVKKKGFPKEDIRRELKPEEEKLLSGKQPDQDALIDLYLAYHKAGLWQDCIGLYGNGAFVPLRKNLLLRLKYAQALNRLAWEPAKDGGSSPGELVNQAEQELEAVRQELAGHEDEVVSLAETLGLMGRVEKDRFYKGKEPAAQDRAVERYSEGFWKSINMYTAINAATMLECRRAPGDQEKKARILQVLRAALEWREQWYRDSKDRADYWKLASFLELRVLELGDQPPGEEDDETTTRCDLALELANSTWQLESTRDNLRLIRQARRDFGSNNQPILDGVLMRLDGALTRALGVDAYRLLRNTGDDSPPRLDENMLGHCLELVQPSSQWDIFLDLSPLAGDAKEALLYIDSDKPTHLLRKYPAHALAHLLENPGEWVGSRECFEPLQKQGLLDRGSPSKAASWNKHFTEFCKKLNAVFQGEDGNELIGDIGRAADRRFSFQPPKSGFSYAVLRKKTPALDG